MLNPSPRPPAASLPHPAARLAVAGRNAARAVVCISVILLAACSTPGSRQTEAGATAQDNAVERTGESEDKEGGTGSARKLLPGRKANYEFEIDAPRAVTDEIRRQTLVGRWQRREDYEPIQFGGLVARLHDEVISIMQSQGYFQAVATVDARPARVSVKVRPGPQATVANMTLLVTGSAAADQEAMAKPQLQSIPLLERGRPFLASAWQDAKREIVNTLNRLGYLRAEVAASEARVDVAAAAVNLDLTVASGPRIAFGELSVEGLQRYDRRIIDDLRPFVPGEHYSEEKLQEYQMRLRGSGYFSSVSALPDLLALQAQPAADRVRIQVVVTELERRRVVFGLGYSTDEGPRGQVGFQHRDLFGASLQLESALVVSAKQQRAFANFRTPYDEDNEFIGFGQRVEREDIENLVTLRSNTYGGFGKREGDIESFTSLQYQIEREQIAGNADTPEERNSQRALVLGKSWTLRRLDSALAPREGYAISAQLSGARAGLMTDRSFLRLHTRATRFQPLAGSGFFKDGLLVGVLELGVVGASSREDIPSENLFRTGGVQSIRGYAYQSLGLKQGEAVVGGRYLALTSLEYQHRITEQYAAALFVDYGNAADSRDGLDPVAGYGVGVRWRTPIGPVNLDVAYGQAVSRYRVHFSIGHTF